MRAAVDRFVSAIQNAVAGSASPAARALVRARELEHGSSNAGLDWSGCATRLAGPV